MAFLDAIDGVAPSVAGRRCNVRYPTEIKPQDHAAVRADPGQIRTW